MPGPSSEQVTAKSVQTKNRIISGFLDLISQRKWFKIYVKEICVSAKITRGTFYQYFDDVYDLMEEIQSSLLNELKKTYDSVPEERKAGYFYDEFLKKFDYAPPVRLCVWFDFCKKNKKFLLPLFDPENGDPSFVKKIKKILKEQVNMMMDNERMPRDSLRKYFLKAYIELHFISVRTWLETGDNKGFLSIEEIINLLNTMRTGAQFLTWKRLTSSDFNEKMDIDRILRSISSGVFSDQIKTEN